MHKAIDGQGGRLIISDEMTDKGPVDGSLWIFKADQGKKPNKKAKKPSKIVTERKKKNVLNKKMKKRKWMKVTAAKGFCGKKITTTL